MKPLLLVPPAQAEALFDAQEYETIKNEAPESALLGCRPWRDDESFEEPLAPAFILPAPILPAPILPAPRVLQATRTPSLPPAL